MCSLSLSQSLAQITSLQHPGPAQLLPQTDQPQVLSSERKHARAEAKGGAVRRIVKLQRAPVAGVSAPADGLVGVGFSFVCADEGGVSYIHVNT